jgi:hypothetical protein
MVKRTLEHISPHDLPKDTPPAIFGHPKSIEAYTRPKRRIGNNQTEARRKLLQQNVSLNTQSIPPEVVVENKGRTGRPLETFVLDRGTGTEEKIVGKSYTIGADHPLIDLWTSPPGTWGAKRIASINNCRIITLKEEKPKSDDKTDVSPQGWTKLVVEEGTSSKPNVLKPREFSNGYGTQIIVSAEWFQIRRPK